MSEESPRICGPCTACCKVFQVLELEKPAGEWCRHCAVGVGCRIYGNNRPTPCKDFRCQWLLGRGEDGHRPDKVRVVVDLAITEDGLPGGICQILEVAEGALGNAYAKETTRIALSHGHWVSHIPLHGKKKIFIPDNRSLTTEILNAIALEGMEIATADSL